MNYGAVILAAVAIVGCSCLLVHIGNVDVEISESDNGTVDIGKGFGRTTVTATPDDGYMFAGWSGDVESIENPLVVDDACTLSACFLPKTTVREYAWMSGPACTESLTIEIDTEEYLGYRDDAEAPRKGIAVDSMGSLAVLDGSSGQIADAIAERTRGLGDTETVGYAARFVQGAIAYESDRNGHDGDYWKYPIETLHDGTGDCEDTSILLATLLDALGYDAALAEFPEHIGCAVAIPGEDGDWTLNGKMYNYIETAVDGTYPPIGYMGFDPADAVLIPLDGGLA